MPSSKVKTIPNERRAKKEIENNNLGFCEITKHVLYDFYFSLSNKNLINRGKNTAN